MNSPSLAGAAAALIAVASMAFPGAGNLVAATTGPDGHGYTARGMDDPGGPTYQFIFLNGNPLARQVVSQPGGIVVNDVSSASPPAEGGIGSAVALGAPFPFYGTEYAALVPAVNGYLSTDPGDVGRHSDNAPSLPASVPPVIGGGARIYPLHDDLVLPSGGAGGIWYRYFPQSPHPHDTTIGVSVFQWDNVRLLNGGTGIFDFEVLLFDNGDILFQYGLSADDKGAGATIGIQNDGATIGLAYAANAPATIPPVPPFPAGGSYAVLFKAPLVVDTIDDPAPGPELSLREAIAAAADGVPITFAPNLAGRTIRLTAELAIPAGANIIIDASALADGGGINLDAEGGIRLLRVGADASARIAGVGFRNGSASGTGFDALGGGILNEGTLTLKDCTIRDCKAGRDGGGIYNLPAGQLHLDGCTVTDCRSLGNQGGGLHNAGTATAFASSFADGTAAKEGGGIFNVNQLALLNCSIHDSQAERGGGIHNAGDATLTNCTLAENGAAIDGGGAFNAGSSVLRLTNCTTAHNVAGASGGGLRNLGTLRMENSLVADNQAATAGPDLAGTLTTSVGRNLIGDAGSAGGLGDLDLRDLDARIGPLILDGGPTKTVPLRAGSPALDAAVTTSPAAFDQRGFPRVVDGDGTPDADGGEMDIGAWEAGPARMVDTADDGIDAGDGKTSLREAIAASTEPGARILFDPTVFAGPTSADNRIQLAPGLGPLDIANRHLSIDASDVDHGVQLQAAGNLAFGGAIGIRDEASVAMHHLTVLHAVSTAIDIEAGSVLAGEDCDFLHNQTTGSAGAMRVSGVADLSDCRFVDNQSWGTGGAVHVTSGGELECRGCLFQENRSTASTGGAIRASLHSRLVVRHGSFVENTSMAGGGAINALGVLRVTDSTFSGNLTHDAGGAVSHQDFVVQPGQREQATLVRCTLSGNRAASGGAIAGNGRIVLAESIVAGNTAASGSDVAEGLDLTQAGSNLVGGDPKLAPVGDYGGRVPTMIPLAGSPAIDAGAAPPDHPATDQRGFPRLVGAAIDLGAVEVGPLIVVNTRADVAGGGVEGRVSLREAVAAASQPGTRIQFDPAVFTGIGAPPNRIAIDPALGSIEVSEPLAARVRHWHLSIDATNIAGGVELDGGGLVRNPHDAPVLGVSLGASLSVHHLAFREVRGHALHAFPGTQLTVDRCRFSDNDGSALNTLFAGPALAAEGRVRVYASAFIANHTEFSGGAAAVLGEGTLVCRDCLFAGNRAALHGGAIWCHTSDGVPVALEMIGCSFLQNRTDSAPENSTGGAIACWSGGVRALNTTFAANTTSGHGGALHQFSSSFDSTVSTLSHCTLSGNSAGVAGGALAGDGFLVVTDCVIAANRAPAGPDVSTTNLINEGNHNLIGGDPQLSPVGDHGGPTPTMIPLPGSPVIDAAADSLVPLDQRGFPRADLPDLGAAEYQGRADLGLLWHQDWDGDGSAFGSEHAVGTDPFTPDPGHRFNPAMVRDDRDHPGVTFGLDPAARADTAWILLRSTDLVVFEEIYRFDGPSRMETLATGIRSEFAPGRITLFDEDPPTGRAFYQFVPEIADPGP